MDLIPCVMLNRAPIFLVCFCRYEASLLDLVEAMSPISAPGHHYRELYEGNNMHTPRHMSRRPSSWYQTPRSSRSRADEIEESRLLEEIFFI